jgi:hypothetical protein
MTTIILPLLSIAIILLFINAYLNDKQHTPHPISDLFKGWMNPPNKDKDKH